MGPNKRNREDSDSDTNVSKKTKVANKDTLAKSSETKKCEQKTAVNAGPELCFFQNTNIFILKAGIEKARLNIFESQVHKYGGVISYIFSNDVTHLIVDDKMDVDKLCRLLKVDTPPSHCPILKSNWLSTCFKNKSLVDMADFITCVKPKQKDVTDQNKANNIHASTGTASEGASSSIASGSGIIKPKLKYNDDITKEEYSKTNNTQTNFISKKNIKMDKNCSDSQSDYSESDVDSDFEDGTGTSNSDLGTSPVKRSVPVESWTCARSSKNPKPNVNQMITEKLEEMIKTYESTNDKWRAFGYQKAVQAIRSHPKPISSWEEARNLRGVGVKLADKIWEIVQSGELRKLNEFKSSDEVKILNLFNNVWGAGPTTARSWYQQGFRSIEDLKTKAKLTSQQKVGVRLYDDLIERMPRSEAGQIETVVREATESLQTGIIAQACGSYRRGKATCGDVDVLITHPDGKSHQGVFTKLISKLTDEGFLTDHLVSIEDSGNQKKYLGVCKLKGDNTKHRRLDIIVVPYNEYGCALMYFTGSAHFNRSLRHLAKKMNMSLNEHALKYGVVRKGNEKLHEGTVIPTPTEKSVFEYFKLPYRSPEERDH